MPRVSVYYAAVCAPDCSVQLCNVEKGEHVGYRTKIHMSDFSADAGMSVQVVQHGSSHVPLWSTPTHAIMYRRHAGDFLEDVHHS